MLVLCQKLRQLLNTMSYEIHNKKQCIILLQDHQVNITSYNFGLWKKQPINSIVDNNCDGYAVLQEPDREMETVLCADERRISHGYVSKRNVVDIMFMDADTTRERRFLLKYEGIVTQYNTFYQWKCVKINLYNKITYCRVSLMFNNIFSNCLR